jgi:hypothetical protein
MGGRSPLRVTRDAMVASGLIRYAEAWSATIHLLAVDFVEADCHADVVLPPLSSC